MECVALGLALVVLVGAAFGLGAWQGASMCVTAQAKVTATIVPQATAAQAKQDAADYERGKQDGIKKGQADQQALDAAKALKARAHGAIKPPPAGCPPQFVPAEQMKGLNDPKIVGDVP
jgi:hypothetical protein